VPIVVDSLKSAKYAWRRPHLMRMADFTSALPYTVDNLLSNNAERLVYFVLSQCWHSDGLHVEPSPSSILRERSQEPRPSTVSRPTYEGSADNTYHLLERGGLSHARQLAS